MLPVLGAKVQSPVRELISQHAERHGQKIKQEKKTNKNSLVMCSVMAFTERAELLKRRMFFKTPGIWPQGAMHIPGASKHVFSIMWRELVGRTSRQIRKPETGMPWTGRGSRACWALTTRAASVHRPWPSHLRQAYDCPPTA